MSNMTREVIAEAIGAAHRSADRRIDGLKEATITKLSGRGPVISAEDFCELLTNAQSLIAQDIKVLLDAVQKH